MAQASSKWPKCIVVVVVGEYQKPNHTISKNIKTLIISRAEKKCFFSPPRRTCSLPLCKQNPILDPLVKRQKEKKNVFVSNAYEHCKWLASPVELIYFYYSWQVLQTSKSRSLCNWGSRFPLRFEGWMTIPSRVKMHTGQQSEACSD